jgi:GTP-binding protein YchF
MKISILGLPQAGQQQLFSLLTGIPLETIQLKPLEVQQGICEVRDPRVAKLVEIYKPKKTVYARIEYLLLPDFNLQGPAKTSIFTQIRNADELCYIVHSANAESDISSFISELIISDLMLAEKRLENIARDQKKKFSEQREKEKTLIEQCKVQLDQERRVAGLEFTEEQEKLLSAYQFLTIKPIILAVNVPEGQIKDQTIAQRITDKFGLPTIQLCAELEEEINRLDSADRAAFMQEVGIEDSALHKMSRLAFAELGLISFFTVGEDEVRAWPIRKGSSAVEAGGAIHSDIAKGFVRAEMMSCADLIAAGSETRLKEQGKFHLKGRDYIVEDGDVLSFRFNV